MLGWCCCDIEPPSIAILQLKRQLLQDDQTKEAIESDVVGGAHVENVALKIFDHADGQDRAANFNK